MRKLLFLSLFLCSCCSNPTVNKTGILSDCRDGRAEFCSKGKKYYLLGTDFSGMDGEKVNVKGELTPLVSKFYSGYIYVERVE
jgi:hypothetical protein